MSSIKRPRGRSKKMKLIAGERQMGSRLTEENTRLSEELIFAKKCLKVLITFKSFVDFISIKFKNSLNSNEWQKFDSLRKDAEEVLKQRLRSDIKESDKKQTPEVVETQEAMSDSNDNYCDPESEVESVLDSKDNSVVKDINFKDLKEELSDSNDKSYEPNEWSDEEKVLITLTGKRVKKKSNFSEDFSDILESKDNFFTKKPLKKKKKQKHKEIDYHLDNKKDNNEESDDEFKPKLLYKSNISYFGKDSKNTTKNEDKSEDKLNETTDKRTDTTKTQITRIQIIPNSKTTEKENNCHSLSSNSENNKSIDSQIKTEDNDCDQSIDFDIFDTNYESEEEEKPNKESNNGLSEENSKKQNPKNMSDIIEGPIFVKKKTTDSSSESKQMEVFKCPLKDCNQWMSRKLIPKHSLKVHKQLITLCLVNDCKHVFPSEEELDLHLNRSHWKGRKFRNCGQTKCYFRSCFEERLERHKSVCSKRKQVINKSKVDSTIDLMSEQKISCPRSGCNKTFEAKFLNKHLMTNHKEAVLKCPHFSCDQRFNNFEKYRKHLESHRLPKEPKKSYCKECVQYFDNRSELREHNLIHIRERPHFKCPIEGCDYTHWDKWYIKGPHFIYKHTNDFPHECLKCGKRFKLKKDLGKHTEYHHSSVVRSFIKCDVLGCNRVFKTNSYLRTHKKNVHQMSQNLKCDYEGCHTVIKTHLGLKVHKRLVHSGKEYPCNWPGCEYKGRSKCWVEKHQTVHSTDRNFVCDWPECGKTYKYRINLEEHMRAHTNDKCYSCDWPECEFRTVSSSSLCKHKQIHKK